MSLEKCVEASANSQNIVAAGSMGADGDLDQPAAANIGLLKVKFPHLHKRNMWGSLNQGIVFPLLPYSFKSVGPIGVYISPLLIPIAPPSIYNQVPIVTPHLPSMPPVENSSIA